MIDALLLESLKELNNIEPDMYAYNLNSDNGSKAEIKVAALLADLGFDVTIPNRTTGSSDININSKGMSGIAFGVNVKSTKGITKRKIYWKYVFTVGSGDGNGKKTLSTDCKILAIHAHDLDFTWFIDTDKAASVISGKAIEVSMTSLIPKTMEECDVREFIKNNRVKVVDYISQALYKYGFIDLNKFKNPLIINQIKKLLD